MMDLDDAVSEVKRDGGHNPVQPQDNLRPHQPEEVAPLV